MRKTTILLLLIMLLGGIFRFGNLERTPPGLYPDEAINGMDAIQTLETGQWKVFYPENNGREGLFIWMIALNFNIFGISVWSLRFTSAIIGFLTILGLFLMAKELFNEKIALLSSFFLAVSFWHTNFSRIGFRAILVPFLMCFSFYFLFKGIKSKKLIYFIIAGIFYGLGFYTYIAFRASILLLGMLLLIKMWNYWKENKSSKWSLKKNYIKDGWWKWDVFFIVILIVVIPLCLHFYKVPQDFMGRANNVSVFNSEQPFKALAISTAKTAIMFNFIGDWNWRHNYSGAPMLAWTVGILFLIGLILIIRKIISDGWKMLSPVILITILWFAIMLLPAIFTIEGIPHALRTISIIPVVYIFAALGFAWMSDKLFKNVNKKLAVIFMATILIHPVYANFNQYFCRWANDPDVAGAFEQNLVDIGNYLNSMPLNIKKYVIINRSGVPVPYPYGPSMPAQTVMFIEHAKNIKNVFYIKPENINQIQYNETDVITLLHPNEEIMNNLHNRWPNGKVRKGNNIWSFLIN
ncbi:ArnT family glycosyltransferase [Patescibacteria group bacterium]